MVRIRFGGYGRSTNMTPKGAMLFFGVFMAMGMIAMIAGVWIYADAQEVKGWPQTTGTISYVDIASEWHSGDHDTASHYEYYPLVEYHYYVDGQPYYGSTISKIRTSSSDIGFAQNFVFNNPIGSEVTVYYNPENPSEAVMQLNSDFESIVPVVLGAVFTLIGASGVIYFYRKWKSA